MAVAVAGSRAAVVRIGMRSHPRPGPPYIIICVPVERAQNSWSLLVHCVHLSLAPLIHPCVPETPRNPSESPPMSYTINITAMHKGLLLLTLDCLGNYRRVDSTFSTIILLF